MHLENRDFNEVVVTLETNHNSYTISNINTTGLPSSACECHLQSLTIESAPIGGTVNPYESGAKGTISVIDYKDAIFKALAGHLDKFITTEDNVDKCVVTNTNELCPTVHIKVHCYTGIYIYSGSIVDWNMSFTGTIPSINLSWSSITHPENAATEALDKSPLKPNSTYKTAKDLFDDIAKIFPNDAKQYPIKFGTPQDDPVWDKIKFPQNSEQDHATIWQPPSKFNLFSGYAEAVKRCVFYDTPSSIVKIFGSIEPIDDTGKKCFLIRPTSPSQATATPENQQVISSVIFVHNGSMPAYSTYKNKTVIPMTSFSFTTDFKKLTLQDTVRQTAVGSVSNNAGETNGSVTQNQAESAAKSASPNNDAVTISFECYNTMAFDVNCLNSHIEILVFNEFGDPHPVSGTMIVRSCSYSLDNGVIKANVECTSVFNNLISSTIKSSSIPASGASDNDDMGVEGDSTQTSHTEDTTPSNNNSSTNSANSSSNLTGVAYLKSEDSIVTPLSKDRTNALINNGIFTKHVQAFLTKYGKLEKTKRSIDYDYVKTLISTGNYGLLTLLLAVCNYGVKGYPSYWQQDAVKLLPAYSKYTAFGASDIGKKPYDYTSGGLGIAHWDSDNLNTIYSTIGFPIDTSSSDRKHFEYLLVAQNTPTNTVSPVSWKSGSFRGQPRILPVFSKGAKMRKFDKGLKQDTLWLKWANAILYFKNSAGEPIYQSYLFELWVKKFWTPTINNLKNKPHACLQDAVRISRADNSATEKIAALYGKNVSEQYDIYSYKGKEVRYDRQKAYSRRCADIIGWES